MVFSTRIGERWKFYYPYPSGQVEFDPVMFARGQNLPMEEIEVATVMAFPHTFT